jgi:hypothetical protein
MHTLTHAHTQVRVYRQIGDAGMVMALTKLTTVEVRARVFMRTCAC